MKFPSAHYDKITQKTRSKPDPVRVYFGRYIFRNTEGGFRLRWSCQGIGAADTLAGMKRLIRERIKAIK